MRRNQKVRVLTWAALYSVLPLGLLAYEAPTWRHSPPKIEEVAAGPDVRLPERPVREERELMRVVAFAPHVPEGTKRVKDPNDPDGPEVTTFVQGTPGYAVLDGPFQVEVRLPDDCNWTAVKRSVGSQIMVDTRYWVSPDNEPHKTVFMPTTRTALCNWDGKPVAEIADAAESGDGDKDAGSVAVDVRPKTSFAKKGAGDESAATGGSGEKATVDASPDVDKERE